MADGFNRRLFLLRATTVAAAGGVASATSLPAVSALLRPAASSATSHQVEAPLLHEGAQLDAPLIAHVTDLSKGEITVFHGERQFSYRDHQMAAKLYHATR